MDTGYAIGRMILMVVDRSNGGLSRWVKAREWGDWVIVYTAHYCERYAERIMQVTPTFATGVDGIMYADSAGIMRVIDTHADGIEEIEHQFNAGQAFGYRDSKSKIINYRTVYSNDMLRGDRKEFRDDWRESLEQLKEWFKS